VSPDVLSERLRELEQAGVVRRGKLPPPAGSRVYELTDWGRELEPVVLGLGRWGSRRAPFPAEHGEIGPDSLVLALKTLFDPVRADGLTASYELRLGERRFEARVGAGRFDVADGPARDPDATISAGPGALQGVLWHGRSPRAPGLEITGDHRTAARFLELFPLPG
jgi:hypothetical protein